MSATFLPLLASCNFTDPQGRSRENAGCAAKQRHQLAPGILADKELAQAM